MKTSPGICNRKIRYASRHEANVAAAAAKVRIHTYRCALCRQFHLTSRTKGMFVGGKSDKAAP